MQEILFSDLSEITVNKQDIADTSTPDKWRVMPYTAGHTEGKLLVAGECTKPNPLTLKLGLTGWHKIFLGMIKIGFDNRFYIKLSNDPWYRAVNMSKEPRPIHYDPHEWIEEDFWCCADLTNLNILLKKPDVAGKFGILTSSLAWIRCVPMTDDEIKAHLAYNAPQRKVHAHFDGDWNLIEEAGLIGPMSRLCSIKDTDIKLCSVEAMADIGNRFDLTDTPMTTQDLSYYEGNKKGAEIAKLRHQTYTDYIRQNGIVPLAALRMSICNFCVPDEHLARLKFPDEHPEYYIRSREGDTIPICSYAYSKVQNYVIDTLKNALDLGYDGVTLMYVRGSHIGFEQPVIDAFKAIYPKIDPCRLPVTDNRLNGVWRSIFTTFMTKLRKALDEHAGKHVHINIVTDFTPETDFHFGIDIREWARLGLIDSMCSDTMETFEDLTDCLADDGLIDLEKYKEEQTKRMVLCRNYDGLDIDRVVEGVKQYLEIEKEYGVEFYACLLGYWRPSIYTPNWEKVRKAGATKFCATNFVHSMPDLPGYHRVSKFGHDSLCTEYSTPKLYRVLSLDNKNIATYNPNWRG